MPKVIRSILKWIGILLGIAAALVIIAYGFIYNRSEERLNQVYDTTVANIPVSSDPAEIKRGRYIVQTRGLCFDCHGENFGGQVFDEGTMTVRLTVPNLTRGAGGIGGGFKDADWVRAIRHGLKKDGKPLVGMLSQFYYAWSDSDLSAVIAYMKSLPPVDNELPETRFGPMGRLLILQDETLLPAQIIDHDTRPPVPEPGVTIEYGKYLAVTCAMCHGENYAGGEAVGAGLNLTPGGALANWSETDFLRALRTGVLPDGEILDSNLMPWDDIGQMTDNELKAVWLFLKTLPPVETSPEVQN